MRATRLLRAAGGHGHFKPLLKDPAIERWHQMREDMYKGFTLTRDNVVPTLTLAVVIPAALYYAMCADLAKGWDLPMTMDDTPSRRSARKPEDIQHGLTGFYNQYETKDA